ncbi:MAG TPA: hypothetical protein VK463_14010 [Desulfomonilaceae bacterium]|nr:hypothetical protein [Desulfomonilaceae bacterium]
MDYTMKYERPKLYDLSTLSGQIAEGRCRSGSRAQGRCQTGHSNIGECRTGSGPSPSFCSAGNNNTYACSNGSSHGRGDNCATGGGGGVVNTCNPYGYGA